MISHSSQLEQALISNQPMKVDTLVDWSAGPGAEWQPLRVISGSHASDMTQTTRWNANGVFATGDYPLGAIHSYGCRMRVRQAVSVFGFGTFTLPAGVYVVTSVQQNRTTLQIQGYSLEEDVIASTFPVARTFPTVSGWTMRKQVELLITEAVPDAVFSWSEALAYNTVMSSMQVDSDRWATISGTTKDASILGSLGGIGFCDATGMFTLNPIPTMSAAPVWSVKSGTMVSPQNVQDRAGVFNLLVVTGTPANGGATIGPVFVWDKEPSSATYAGPDPVNHPELAGPYGVKPIRYDNPLITDTAQGLTAGKGLLAQYLGAHEVLTVDSRYCPFIEAGDVIAAEDNGGTLRPHLLDTVTTTWGAAKTTLVTRSPKENIS